MVEEAKGEFWKDIKPIEKVFKPDAAPETYVSKPADSDIKYFVPFTETVSSRPMWISPQQNMWSDILMATEAGLVNRHYHPHEVFAYTISGKWGYLEHDWTASAGDFIYESPGEAHTLVAFESDEPMKAMFVVKGPLIWLDDDGQEAGFFDVHDYIKMAREHYDKVGIGAGEIDKLIR
jgi:2,4'-dihydroxyacetophenone dioxygenase